MSREITIPSADANVDINDAVLARDTTRRVSVRLLPFLFLLFVCNFLDRTNVSVAALQMNRDLHFSAAAYGFGAGVFFVGYALFEIPSNLILARVGARRWIARIMITWGVVASAMMFVTTPSGFYLLRFLLGVAEAGFYPGIVYYLSRWVPARDRARALSRFMIAIPVSAAIGNPLSASFLLLDGRFGFAGWQWLFLLEGLPSIVLGIAALGVLADRFEDARWLSPAQRQWLAVRLRNDEDAGGGAHGVPLLRAMRHPVLWRATLLYFLMMMTNYSYAFWAPTIIRDALHATNMATGLVTGAIAVVAIIVMLLVGASADRTGERAMHAAACALLSAVACLAVGVFPQPVIRVIALALVFAGVEGFLAPFWCLPGALFRGSTAAAAIALVNSVGNVGGFVAPYAVGVIKDTTGGTSAAFIALAAVTLAGAVLCVTIRRNPRP